jgi:hypothetical protein
MVLTLAPGRIILSTTLEGGKAPRVLLAKPVKIGTNGVLPGVGNIVSYRCVV